MPLETLHDTPRASLLGLPSEMRQQIYLEYFTIEGGYVYDSATDKIVQANHCPIDLSLRQVCRTIARETYDYPFTLNTITFSTAYRRDWRKKAAALDFILSYHCLIIDAMLARLRHCSTPDMYDTPSQQDSRYMPPIKQRISDTINFERRRPDCNIHINTDCLINDFKKHWGNTQNGGDMTKVSMHHNNISRNRAYTNLLRQIASKHPEKFREAIDDLLPGWAKSKSSPTSDFFNLGFEFWAIPSLPEITDTVERFELGERWDNLDLWRYSEYEKEGYTGKTYCYQRKHFFSAAALAIRFLKSISQTQRLLITKLTLNEDRMAFGNPECHIIGLIPFIKENPKLFIKHQVSLWRNIFPRGCATELSGFPTANESIIEPEEGIPGPHQVHYQWASRIISIFIMHTLEAMKEGLPPNSYCLILDGEPEMNHATKTFRYLMDRKIAWMTANTDCVAQGVLASPKSKNYPLQTCFSTSELVAVHDRGSIIQCNFTLDQPWNYNTIAGDKGKTIKRWKSVNAVERDYGDDQDGLFDVSNGKVDWMQIKGEYFEMKPRSDLSEGEIRALKSGGLRE
ncbi:hypothetical protein FDENT_951 [Fusarium denticulatum]|uniref:Uncharacterized protein n=1 Tax=Fusarium denticulatum TaxID=48507 RepID=A0A8H5XJB1_9HYPO|nr:hypothetical protein FDENT_951 [Fusarium denticulatum]